LLRQKQYRERNSDKERLRHKQYRERKKLEILEGII
jgi:Zn-finger nucleic acid-binding protein